MTGLVFRRRDSPGARHTSSALKAETPVARHLEIAGLHFGHIVEMTTYHVDLRKHLNAFVKVKDEFVEQPYPAWNAIGVTELITQRTLLEIRIIAKRG